jgi:hypothetical protein
LSSITCRSWGGHSSYNERIWHRSGFPSALPHWGNDLPLLSGIVNADKVITVSPSYAKEILTPDFGNGLQDFLHTQQINYPAFLTVSINPSGIRKQIPILPGISPVQI